MRRGTTPSHIFTCDIDLTDAEVLYISYEQEDKIIIEKTLDDVTIDAETITVKLTQAETLALKMNQGVKIQIRARFPDGTAVASNIINTRAEEILKEGEI